MKAFDVTQAQSYWMRIHAASAQRPDGASEARLLEPVCHPGWPLWFNSYVAHNQRKAFLDALRHCGELRERDVLEVGCGTGRWTVLLRDRGAHVRAIDLSPEAVDANRRRIAGVDFRRADLLNLPLNDECVDLAVSVTVIQHIPYEAQPRAVAELARVLRGGGKALLLENIRDRGRHVFARSLTEWRRLFATSGFQCLYEHGYSYDLPLRAGRTILSLGTAARRHERSLALDEPPLRRANRLAAVAYRPLVIAGRLIEPISWRLLPVEAATHCAFVFERS